MDNICFQLIGKMQMLSPEALTMIELSIFLAFLLVLFRYFGKIGLIMFSCLSIVLANVQVLKETQFIFALAPMGLGTVLFCLTFLVSDILTEHYGASAARQNIWLCFLAQLFSVFAMVCVIAYPTDNSQVQSALQLLFTPSLRFLLASIISFCFSQMLDVILFQAIRNKLPSTSWLWLRSSGSTLVSSLFDTCVFSLLAFYVFAPNPMGWDKLFFGYVLGTYIFRFVITALSTPFIYLTFLLRPSSEIPEYNEEVAPIKKKSSIKLIIVNI